MNPTELAIQRQNTEAFIQADPVVIVLMRSAKQDLPDGGYKMGEPTPVKEQIFRMVPINDTIPAVQTPDGVQRTPTYVLLGQHDADMALWDKFELNGHKYQIVNPIRPVHTADAYERKGDVALL